MTLDRYLRMIAGGFVLLTLALGYWMSREFPASMRAAR